jgi:carbon-monoxide dehydrogenase medium subunit
MIPGDFQYHSAASISEAIKLLGEFEDAKILAGGHSLLPMAKLRFAEPAHLIDINGIDELKGIRLEGDTLVIGAMTTETELLRSELVEKHCPLVTAMAKQIADPQIRNRGTIGGDIAHGDPGNDHPTGMIVLDADFVIHNADGERTTNANGFFMGTYWTELEEGDLLTSIRIPVFTPTTGFGYHKLKRKSGDFAVAAALALLRIEGGVIQHARIGVTNVSSKSERAEAAENILIGNAPSEALIDQAAKAVADACDPSDGLAGDAQYQTAMAVELSRRSLRDAVKMAGGSL